MFCRVSRAIAVVIFAGLAHAAADKTAREPATDSHKVRRGETLWGISRLHGVSVGEIMDLNHLNDSTVRDGQVLKIPRAGADPALAPAKSMTHVVAKGETFRSIARKYGLTQDDLERANPKTDPSAPKAGTKLVIPATVSLADKGETVSGKSKPVAEVMHTVTEKDTFHTIAKKYGVTEDAVASANPNANPNRLRPGSKLYIPPRKIAVENTRKNSSPADPPGRKTVPGDEASADPAESRPRTRRYVVSADETPQTISEAFNISVRDLYRMNDLEPGLPMKAGLEIQVPVSPIGEP